MEWDDRSIGTSITTRRRSSLINGGHITHVSNAVTKAPRPITPAPRHGPRFDLEVPLR